MFNDDGKLIKESTIIDENSEAYYSCSTMFNGKAMMFGGSSENKFRQVASKKTIF